jgi:hypothetical protein
MQLSPNNPTLALARPAVECAQCGKHLFAPEWSEYLDDRHVRHLWACESCDYSFETLVRFPDLRAA